ncbi:ubiquinol oxidase subunit II [Candidatus Saccharibacteria bacterium]|nr:MAG: ubiquinol oxidase subunit II [Candidatus Saccharibacteria bacterium]
MMKGFKRVAADMSRVKVPAVPRVSRTKMTVLWLVGGALVVGLLVVLSLNHSFPLLQTRGEIANRQRDLLVFATALALLVLVPVYFMIFTFAWRYRAGHKQDYKPEWDTHKGYEALWWGIPIAIISVLAVVTWVTSHSLDPFKPLASSQKPLQVQVVALQWKWLFIYPEQGVASVNEVAFPASRPVEFTMTSDAPMNSFWIPQLAGQIYVMSGMSTKLHVVADVPGVYQGMSSNISGKGFADMKFKGAGNDRT